MKPPNSPILRSIVEFGLPGLLWGTGMSVAFTGAQNFWAGMWIAAAAAVLLIGYAAAVWRRVEWQYASLIFGSGVLMLAFIGWLTFRPAPLDVLVQIGPGHYPTGTEVGGVPWPGNSTELDVSIKNQADWPYSDLEFFVQTNLSLGQIGLESQDEHCEARPVMPEVLRNLFVQGYTDKGEFVTEPVKVDPKGSKGFVTRTVRIHCDRLSAHGDLRAVIAVFDLRAVSQSGLPPIPNPRSLEPSWALVEASYEAEGRRHAIQRTQCFLGACPNVPRNVDRT